MFSDKRILVALSGGLDSGVAALLLQEAGWQVEGVHFLFPSAANGKRPLNFSLKALKKSKEISRKLGIKLHIVDVRQEFYREVITDFIKRSKKGETPNPCIVCNEKIKFKKLIALADSLKINKVATGHYVGKVKKTRKGKEGKLKSAWFVCKAKDSAKDQSYFLCRLKSSVIRRCEFPLEKYLVKKVRQIARKSILPPFTKEENSQGLCFLKGSPGDFLEKNIAEQPGKIIDQKGRTVGEHSGLSKYTIGQRKGIKIGGSGPYFTIGKDYNKNELQVSNVGDAPELFKDEITASIQPADKRRFLFFQKSGRVQSKNEKTFYLKVRYGQQEKCIRKIIFSSPATVKIKLKQKVRAVTPGQIAALYDQEGTLIFGGVIK